MATIFRPMVAVNSVWDTSAVTLIDEAVTQPTAGSGDIVIADPTDDFERQIYGTFKNGSAVPSDTFTTVGSITVWCYCKDDGGGDTTLDVDVHIDGVTETPQQFAYTGSYAWYSKEFTGSWSASDVDSMQVGLTTGDDPDLNLDVMYVEIEEAASSGSPIFMVLNHWQEEEEQSNIL